MFVFLGFKGSVFCLEFDDDLDVDADGRVGRVVVGEVFVFDETSCELTHIGRKASLPVDEGKRSEAILFRHAEVVGAKAGCDVDDACTVFGGDEVTDDDLEGVAVSRLHIGHELLVAEVAEL